MFLLRRIIRRSVALVSFLFGYLINNTGDTLTDGNGNKITYKGRKL